MPKLFTAVLTILVVGTCALKKVKDFGNMSMSGDGGKGEIMLKLKAKRKSNSFKQHFNSFIR